MEENTGTPLQQTLEKPNSPNFLKRNFRRKRSQSVSEIDFVDQDAVFISVFQVEFHGIAPGTERELFQRVQLGMPLTAAGELHRALYFL